MQTQLFGAIQTPAGSYHTMLCRDLDQPEFGLISWWQPELDNCSGNAALARFVPIDSQRYNLEFISFFRTDANGALLETPPDDEKAAELSCYQIELQEMGEWFAGKLTHRAQSQMSGEIFFAATGKPSSDLWEVQTCNRWEDFKHWAAEVRRCDRRAVFRGHGSNRFRLQSTIHRHGRTRFERYFNETLKEFKNHLEAVLEANFDMSNAKDYGTLLGLAQHHGLPTPLLDFTDSPYIAAYFAFSDAVESKRPDVTHVRVVAMSGDYLAAVSSPQVVLSSATPYFSFLSLSPRHNPRLYAQQGRFLITNVSNPEGWLRAQYHDQAVLVAADIPVTCAAAALDDLRYMGLTAATLFPGIDGICKMMRQGMILSAENHP